MDADKIINNFQFCCMKVGLFCLHVVFFLCYNDQKAWNYTLIPLDNRKHILSSLNDFRLQTLFQTASSTKILVEPAKKDKISRKCYCNIAVNKWELSFCCMLHCKNCFLN